MASLLTGHRFFPSLVSHPFDSGIHQAFYFAAGCAVAAIASRLRGGKYYRLEVAQPELVGADLAATQSYGSTGAPVDVTAIMSHEPPSAGARPRTARA